MTSILHEAMANKDNNQVPLAEVHTEDFRQKSDLVLPKVEKKGTYQSHAPLLRLCNTPVRVLGHSFILILQNTGMSTLNSSEKKYFL